MSHPSPVRTICCIGAGYVGGPTMAVIADRCPEIQVTVVDLNAERIAAWNDPDLSRLPVYEPGLDAVVGRCRGRNLHFSTAVEPAIAAADLVFLSVNTPTKTKGVGAGQASDLRWIEASARQVAACSQGHTIVVEKSTLPVRTAETVQAILTAAQGEGAPGDGSTPGKSFSVLSNPEFLAEGTAIADLENPDRVLIGGEDPVAIEALADIYAHWVAPEQILRTNLWSSELSKLTANAFLAQRISSINSIAAFCEATGADVQEVARAIGTDSRIGPKFLKAGPGFGGSCFQKDILNLVYLCGHYGLHEVAAYWQSVVDLNSWQQHRIARLVVRRLFGTVTGKRLAVLGFAFKADTNDTREAPAIRICRDLLEEGAQLAIYDPKVCAAQIARDLGQAELPAEASERQALSGEGSWRAASSAFEAGAAADAALILTEWGEFAQLDWQALAAGMRQPAWVFDARAVADAAAVRAAGLQLWRVGEG
ncbi:nucleotide sugar dehydrogenase [Vulcanococcus limneticus Candia 3F8]|uniref:nucleotide sugar dehydrogenase n=1 Tax=Vulcanococcus limneticus TaxID=2170428 RepID=UPI000B99BF02|nr:nucleotide sugar dehydrogenase [Vulcanococcus limneticus]MCP9793056.1 nucleotide sugar dehydrogenase [Vulcanococcus limneticus MW73D5]MCP9894956.1 nucleotide sugar dehydrogenase [Vulcanococcus limneticus Candia 3F8]MCP9898454.1 nucleotide sugar dehydrogenase [Vulcanococcus limneticus Candia 3B3]